MSENESFSLAIAENVLRRWAEGCAMLRTMPPPAGFSPARWRRAVKAADHFIKSGRAGEAIGCGWSDLDVFGCHSTVLASRYDCMGLVLLLDRCEITAIDDLGANLVTTSGARQRFYRRPMPPGTVLLWELGK